MGYWLKSFNKKPNPVPGVHFTIPQINYLPNVTSGLFIGMALIWGWLTDGPLRGRRYPFIYAGAVISVSSLVVM
jgi:ACS family pantothenate transporter-like MFS transporter